MKIYILRMLLVMLFYTAIPVVSYAATVTHQDEIEQSQEVVDFLMPHKALYDIDLVATRSGSQIVNISGQMLYEWKPACDAWVTDHRFTLLYEYADSPGMKVSSDFSTYETFDGESFNFSARRKRNNTLYQELRGQANLDSGEGQKTGKAVFTMPDELQFDLNEQSFFPMSHTVEMINKARNNQKFFQAVVFDGSDDEGPVEINSFIGQPINALKYIKGNKTIDMNLLNTPAWKVRMAVFPKKDKKAQSDYEMDLIFHENGVISDMVVDYEDFSVSQKLVALEQIQSDSITCDVDREIN